MTEPREIYMIHVNYGGSVFVKTYEFFKAQGGFREDWGTQWKPVVATSIEHARFLGCRELAARPYERQAEYDPEIIKRFGPR